MQHQQTHAHNGNRTDFSLPLLAAEPSVESRMPRWVTASPSGSPGEETEGFSMVSPLPTPSNLTKTNTSDNITAQLGASVFLPCKTHHSMERQVSWGKEEEEG